MRVRRAFSGAEHRIADPGRSCQRLSTAKLEPGSDVLPIGESNQRKLDVLDSITLGIVIGDTQPNAQPSTVRCESLPSPIPAACGIDSSL